MVEVYREKFSLRHDRGGGKYNGLIFNDCIFSNCSLSLTKDISLLSIAENITLSNCKLISCDVGPSYLKDITLDNIDTGDMFFVWSALFHHVVLKNKIGNIRINDSGFELYDNPKAQQELLELKKEFYANIDWALDISQAKFMSFTCEGIQARLIRRDSSTQVVVKRDKFISIDNLDEGFKKEHSDISFILELFLRSGAEDVVLVTPLGRNSKYSKPIFSGLMKLRNMGIAEAD